tara:strand:+ start:283 stop:945 length:663 start_codon:yes stop_codon:yes gene_type:complete
MKHPTPYFLTLLFITMAPSTKNFPIDQLEKKLEIYRLFENLFELTDYSLLDCFLDSLVEQINLERKNTEEFYTHLGENEKMQKKHFGTLNLIDGLFWLKVNKNIKTKEEQVTATQELPVKDGFINSGFVFSTGKTCNLLKVTASDLSAFRSTNELVEDVDYIRQKKKDGTTAKYAPYLYNIEKTCVALYNISYEKLRQPGFDLEKHKREETRKVFDSINK